MKDQVRAMKERDIRAVYVGDCTDDERDVSDTCAGKYQLIYMSPEALLTNEQWQYLVMKQ